MLEPTLGIVSICLPVISPAIILIIGKLRRLSHPGRTVPKPLSSGNVESWRGHERTRDGSDAFSSLRHKWQGGGHRGPVTMDLEMLDNEFPLVTRGSGDTGASRAASITGEERPVAVMVERGWEVMRPSTSARVSVEGGGRPSSIAGQHPETITVERSWSIDGPSVST